MKTIEEKSPFSGGGKPDVIFPLGLVMSPDSHELTLSFLPEFRSLVPRFAGLSFDDCCMVSFRNSIMTASESLLEALGYAGEIITATEYYATDQAQIDRCLIQASTAFLTTDPPYENLTTCLPDPLREGLLCCGTVIDGKIVSAANENPHYPTDPVVDIGIETAPGFDGYGYGTSNVASLAYRLLESGKMVTYIADDENVPSRRIAEKVGFFPGQREWRLIGYRFDEESDIPS